MPEGLLSRRLTLQRTAQTKAGMPLDSSSVSVCWVPQFRGRSKYLRLRDTRIIVRSLVNASRLGNLR